MRVITKTEEVIRYEQKQIFVAFDGKEFSDKKICENYERETKIEIAKKTVENCTELEGFLPFNGGENYESHNYLWFRAKKKEEIKTLRDAFGNTIDDNDIGVWICVEDCGDFEFYVTPITYCIDYANSVMEKLGYRLVLEEIKE